MSVPNFLFSLDDPADAVAETVTSQANQASTTDDHRAATSEAKQAASKDEHRAATSEAKQAAIKSRTRNVQAKRATKPSQASADASVMIDHSESKQETRQEIQTSLASEEKATVAAVGASHSPQVAVKGRKKSNHVESAEKPKPSSKQVQETQRKVTEILGAAVKMHTLQEEPAAAQSSYAFETVVNDVQSCDPLRTYRVQVDYGKRDKMVQGHMSHYMPLLPQTGVSSMERPPIYAMLPLLTQGTTAPQMPPPKINDPNMAFNWSHLVDEWPLRSNRPCSYCMHKFECIPWFIPVKRIESYYKMDDSEHVFCSYPCERRFLLQSGYPDRFIYLVYLNDIARNYFGWKGDLLAAPLRLWLETMTIEEYRSYLCPPVFYEFPVRERGAYAPSHESKWMSDMTMLRPPFLSGAAIMEWVANVVPRAHQSTKVLYDSSRPRDDVVSAALLMGPLGGESATLNRDTLGKIAKQGVAQTPWKVEGLRMPNAKEMEENESHRIVLPPLDPDAPAFIDEVIEMRKAVARGDSAKLSERAASTSYAQQLDGLIKSKSTRKQLDASEVLTQMIESTATTNAKAKRGKKRSQRTEDASRPEDDDNE